MNHPSDQTRLTLSRPLTERIAAAIRDALRSRHPRAFDDIVDLDARMLRDIGAPSWLISRAVERREVQPGLTRVGAVRGWARLVAVAGIALLAASVLGAPSARACEVAIQAPMEGVFTGEFVHGVPVYRLASITVSAPRNAEPARSTAQPRDAPRVSRASPVVVTGVGRSPS